MNPKLNPPDARLLISSGCPHCASLIKILEKLVKTGKVGEITITNIEVHPEAAAEVGIRSVPWTQIGEFELLGAQTEAELTAWVEHASRGTGMPEYLADLLQNQQLAKAITLSQAHPPITAALISLLADPETAMGVRIGIAAIMEELTGSEILVTMVDQLGELSRSTESRIRADACHFLGLSHHNSARPYLIACLEDQDPEVREIAKESLELLP